MKVTANTGTKKYRAKFANKQDKGLTYYISGFNSMFDAVSKAKEDNVDHIGGSYEEEWKIMEKEEAKKLKLEYIEL